MKFSFYGALSNAFWHGNQASSKGNSQNEVIPLLVILHLSYTKYWGVKICFHSRPYQNQNFSLMSRSCLIHVSLVSHSCRSCPTRVAIVSLMSGTRVVNQTRSLRYCSCKKSPIVIRDHDHIITGNLLFIENEHLRELISKGSNSLEARTVNWNKYKNTIKRGIGDCT